MFLTFGKTGAGGENANSMQKGPALAKNHTQDFLTVRLQC